MKTALAIIDDVGRCILFVRETLAAALRKPPAARDIVGQIWVVTSQSASTTALAGFFVGAVMTIQFGMQLKGFGALGYLGGLATSGVVREVGPLLIAFMLSGKLGAFTSAELGTMRVTEQIDAIRCLGSDPLQEIVFPRLVAIVISSFFLLTAGMFASIGGGLLLGVTFAGVTADEYLRHIPTIVALPSILGGLFKCFVFAGVIGAICTYKGYTTTGGAKGVGRSVVSTAVATMVGLVIADSATTLIAEAALVVFGGGK